PARELRDVVHVGRPTMVEHYIIGNVDERADRALTCGLETSLHPLRGGSVPDPANCSAEECRTAFGVVDADRYRAWKATLNLRNSERLQLPDACCGEIACDPSHTHCILPIGRDVYVEHGIVESGKPSEGLSHRRIGR